MLNKRFSFMIVLALAVAVVLTTSLFALNY